MIKKILGTTVVVLSLLFIGCNDDDSGSGTGPTVVPSPIGTWTAVIPANPFDPTSKSASVKMVFTDNGDDTTFNIVVAQLPDEDTVYTSGGTASMSSGSLTITGSDCMILDTTTNQMVAIPDDQCSTPLTLTTAGLESDKWMVQGADVKDMPFLDDSQKTLIESMTIQFTKEN